MDNFVRGEHIFGDNIIMYRQQIYFKLNLSLVVWSSSN